MEKSATSEIQKAANASIKTETGTSSENENQDERYLSTIKKMYKELEPSVSNKCRIYKVPYHLRTLNPKAYNPHAISIGPYHHNNKNCRTMEKHKVRYFQSFMKRDTKGLKMENSVSREMENEVDKKMENLVSTIREMENEIRSCYVETVQLKSVDFVKMIMLDASFILDLFLKSWFKELTTYDPMWVEAWLVSRELLLLENQLPFFVIEKLYHLALPSLSNSTSLIQLTFHFFGELNINNKSPSSDVEIQHFTDLLRFFQLPPQLPDSVAKAEISFLKYSATQLHEAGVTFKVAKCVPDGVALSICDENPSSKCLLDVVASCVRDGDPSSRIWDLSFENKVLEIPQLLFNDNTEAHVRNIMALEQCHPRTETYVTHFYIILDHLIDTDKDVEFLINKEILVNGLGDNNAVKSMINSLNKGINCDYLNSKFCQLSARLNKHYERRCNKWRAMLKQQYFSNPWRSAATIAAIILLVLTLIQTVFSIHK